MVSLGQEQLSLFSYEIAIFLIVISLTAVVARISRTLIDKAMRSYSPYLAARIRNYVFVLVWSIGIILGIRQVGISTDILMLLMALVGIGFIVSGLHVLQNFISHSFMNLQMQYKVGDVISISDFSGKVIEITDLGTVLLDDEGNLVSIPNVMFLKEIWVKHRLSGYEMTIPVVIKKELDVVNFEKELLNSLTELKKYFKKEPHIVTSKINDKTIELSLILNIKDPEKKSVVTVEIDEKVKKLIAESTEKAANEKKEAKLKEIKDLSK